MVLAQDNVDVNAKDAYERTPFWYAVERGHKEVTGMPALVCS